MKNETIVDRVVERLKLQPLGDLITEEDLHDIVKQAIPKVFFENRTVQDGSYRTQTLPPIIVELMGSLLKESAQKACEKWLIENAEMTADYWKKVLDENLLAYVQKIMDQKASEQVKQMLVQYISTMNQERSKMGLPPIYV